MVVRYKDGMSLERMCQAESGVDGRDDASVQRLNKCGVNGRRSVAKILRPPQIRLYSGIGKNQEKCALLKTRELRAARFVRKFLYKNTYAPKAACICELLLGLFEKCAQRSAQYQKLYFDYDNGLYCAQNTIRIGPPWGQLQIRGRPSTRRAFIHFMIKQKTARPRPSGSSDWRYSRY